MNTDEIVEVIATVIVERKDMGMFDIVFLETDDHYRYALTRHTPDIVLADIKEGQKYRLIAYKKFARVIKAELLTEK